MKRYMIERNFPSGLAVPMDDAGAAIIDSVNDVDAADGVTWLHSYVSEDHTKTFCIYDAPSDDAVRAVARRNDLPVERITPVSVLAAHPYR
ncbi:DUF4242 domain-containing protein [soil metagenome]